MPLSSVLGAQSLVRPGVCTSTTRPASPFEGQLIYESDTDKVLAYNGSVWEEYRKAGAGQVLQVVNATHATEVTTTSTTFVTTGLTASITPSSTTSKILALVSMPTEKTTDSIFSPALIALFRGTVADTQLISQNFFVEKPVATIISFFFLDSPSIATSQTYTVGLRTNSGLVTVKSCVLSQTATLTLMEISA